MGNTLRRWGRELREDCCSRQSGQRRGKGAKGEGGKKGDCLGWSKVLGIFFENSLTHWKYNDEAKRFPDKKGTRSRVLSRGLFAKTLFPTLWLMVFFTISSPYLFLTSRSFIWRSPAFLLFFFRLIPLLPYIPFFHLFSPFSYLILFPSPPYYTPYLSPFPSLSQAHFFFPAFLILSAKKSLGTMAAFRSRR